jgi:chromosome segregation ATPase
VVDYSALRKKDLNQFEDLELRWKNVHIDLTARQLVLDQREITIKELKVVILKLEQTILSLELLVSVKNDLSSQLDQATHLIEKLQDAKERLQRELETAGDYLLEQEEKTYKANQTSLELLRQLKDAENEIDTLKQYIIELKTRVAIYIPSRDDPVDRKLAEFINNYPERSRLKIMFMRESEGIY